MKRANRTMTSRTRSGSGPVLPSHQEAMPRVGVPTGVRAVLGGRGLLPCSPPRSEPGPPRRRVTGQSARLAASPVKRPGRIHGPTMVALWRGRERPPLRRAPRSPALTSPPGGSGGSCRARPATFSALPAAHARASGAQTIGPFLCPISYRSAAGGAWRGEGDARKGRGREKTPPHPSTREGVLGSAHPRAATCVRRDRPARSPLPLRRPWPSCPSPSHLHPAGPFSPSP